MVYIHTNGGAHLSVRGANVVFWLAAAVVSEVLQYPSSMFDAVRTGRDKTPSAAASLVLWRRKYKNVHTAVAGVSKR